jgi:hypothetical protein
MDEDHIIYRRYFPEMEIDNGQFQMQAYREQQEREKLRQK